MNHKFGEQVWQVTRMYLTHLSKPNVSSLLLGLLQREPYKDLGERLWVEKKKGNQRAKQGWEILITEREALRKDEGTEDSVQNKEGGSNEDIQLYQTFGVSCPFPVYVNSFLFQTAEDFGDYESATEGTTDRFSNEKEFLFRTLGFGHLNLLRPGEVELISPDELRRVLGSQRAERWFSELLESTSVEELQIARLPISDTKSPYQRLFFSGLYVFQQHIETQRLPILSLADQGRIVVVTNLPNDCDLLLLEPEPAKFWEHLVRKSHIYN